MHGWVEGSPPSSSFRDCLTPSLSRQLALLPMRTEQLPIVIESEWNWVLPRALWDINGEENGGIESRWKGIGGSLSTIANRHSSFTLSLWPPCFPLTNHCFPNLKDELPSHYRYYAIHVLLQREFSERRKKGRRKKEKRGQLRCQREKPQLRWTVNRHEWGKLEVEGLSLPSWLPEMTEWT